MRFLSPADFMCHICNQIARIIIGTVPFLQNPGCIKKFDFKFTLLQLFPPSFSSSAFAWRRSEDLTCFYQCCQAALLCCHSNSLGIMVRSLLGQKVHLYWFYFYSVDPSVMSVQHQEATNGTEWSPSVSSLYLRKEPKIQMTIIYYLFANPFK